MKSKLASIIYDSRMPNECIVCRDERVNWHYNLSCSTINRLERAMKGYDTTIWIVLNGVRIFIYNEKRG